MKKVKTIAIIDDDDIYHFVTKRKILALSLDIEILNFLNGKEALDFFNSNIENINSLPDLIFLDLNMPILNGWQFLNEYETIKDQIEKEVVIYITTSSESDDDIKKINEISTVSDYIIKPLVAQKIQEIMDGNQ